MANNGKMFDVQIPFFAPMWRRVLTVVVLLLWTGMEVSQGAYVWALLFGGPAIYMAHQFFIAWDPPED
jgi:hypothetical protein